MAKSTITRERLEALANAEYCKSNPGAWLLGLKAVEVRYVAPPGYVMVPKEPTREILDEFDSIIDYGAEDSEDAWRRLLAAAQQEVKP